MNATFLTWLTVAAVVGGALLLILGMPGNEQAAPLVLEPLSTEEATTVAGSGYWEPVTSFPTAETRSVVAPVAQRVDANPHIVQPCNECGMASPVRMAPAYGCGSCGAGVPSPVVPIYMQYPHMASCEQRVPSPCGPVPCSGLPMTCVPTCGSTCPLSQPGINRNMDLCVDECTFVQLHTTIPHPICATVQFEWTTSKGSFLEADVSDPIYFVPTTQFAEGEDVWVVVKITDARGTQYTDHLKLHVVNQR